MSRVPEAYRKIARAAKAAGWAITPTRGGHLAWTPPEGRVIYTPSTPSDCRSFRNNLADFRRAGLKVG